MKRLASPAMAFTLIAFAGVSCGRRADQPPTHDTPMAVPAPSNAVNPPLDITFRTDPEQPKAGETSFDVSVTGANSPPLTDADVSVQFYMAAMPEMKMPEMRNTIPLRHEGGGRYRGKGNILTAGTWDVTVIVKRGGQELGKRTLAVTAQ